MSAGKVLVLMGSGSDWPVMKKCTEVLERLAISHDVHVASAHRTPQRVVELVEGASAAGCRVIVAGAGMAAHLAGVVAAHTTLPVLGVPLASGALQGVDALLSVSQMPPGIPVACLGIGSAGASNAGLLAAAILALDDEQLAQRLRQERRLQAQKVEQSDAELQQRR